ncbi:hypothetical protein BGLA2_30052 [Burkholderia gladioli]|nr:hypothetical protein BGLA2_30052 [Burkholderia gladioli]
MVLFAAPDLLDCMRTVSAESGLIKLRDGFPYVESRAGRRVRGLARARRDAATAHAPSRRGFVVRSCYAALRRIIAGDESGRANRSPGHFSIDCADSRGSGRHDRRTALPIHRNSR